MTTNEEEPRAGTGGRDDTDDDNVEEGNGQAWYEYEWLIWVKSSKSDRESRIIMLLLIFAILE